MKTQIVLLSVAFLAINPSGTFNSSLPAKSSENVSIKITKTQSTDFAFLRTHRQGKGVVATWGLISNNGVAGFLVQRTYQDPTDPYAMWDDVNSMSCSSSRSFKFCDENVFPGYINYRVVAVMEDGNSVTSEISGVRIVSH